LKQLLLTGGSGFIGSFLKPALEKSGYEVATPDLPQFDLLIKKNIEEVVGSKAWDVVIHLAAMSHVVDCKKDPERARAINFDATREIFRTAGLKNPKCHFIFASTAQVYSSPQGDEIKSGVIFDENRRIEPQNLYAETKWLAEKDVQLICSLTGISATILRLFNHTHKSQSSGAFLPHIYQQLLKGETRIPVGNLNVSRDIGAIQDLVQAFTTILERRKWNFETFNICTGQSRNMGTLAKKLAERLEVKVEFVMDPSRVRANEPVSIRGSYEKFWKATGWLPAVQSDDDLISAFLKD
jgi:GDP-4-dehydro-6-deoxy-D-mannose reductase